MDWYTTHVVDTGRAPALFALVGFVVTFVVVRSITRRIRARREAARTSTPDPDRRPRRALLGDVSLGGVHVHHQVWGILLVLLTGMLQFRYSPGHPWSEVLALLFGAGAALALDEFALWLYVDDVYWSEEGQRSIDAILVGGALGGALLLSASPIGITSEDAQGGWLAYTVTVVVHLALAFLCVLKGKLATGLVGIVVPVVAFVGAVRLAKPSSPWARRRYARRPHRLARAQERFGARYQARWERVRTLVGGRADDRPPTA
ncbi:hypothetical protein [Cellulosimicrobium protaetiae]|uniref:Integral membrane protein n=1 Tax=Cellulosimicrobium protaetiae TaxID=2587808 RepID=A0A6M5UHS3_9MICO|nr:hypothetical protein [Cellulosimicrobium protaetiae]QJW36763.1 hypothetical protein FIC82_011745 [Cellulosimicrobium protaetiae]